MLLTVLSKGKTTLLTNNFAEKDSSVISKKKMSLLSSKSHFWPAKVTSVHQFLLATTSSLSKGVKRQFCLLKRQFCPVMILTSKLANSVKKLHLSVKTLRISFHLTYAGNKSFILRRTFSDAIDFFSSQNRTNFLARCKHQ